MVVVYVMCGHVCYVLVHSCVFVCSVGVFCCVFSVGVVDKSSGLECREFASGPEVEVAGSGTLSRVESSSPGLHERSQVPPALVGPSNSVLPFRALFLYPVLP